MSASAFEIEETQRKARFLKFWKIAVNQLGSELFIVDCASENADPASAILRIEDKIRTGKIKLRGQAR